MSDTRFEWHPDAVLIAGDRRLTTPEGGGEPVIPDRPAARMADVMARAEAGDAFRLTAGEPLPPHPSTPETFQVETGGTTSAPKIVERSQSSWLRTFGLGSEPTDRGVVAIPGRLSHSLALYGAIEGLHLGSVVHLLDGIRPDRWTGAMRAAGATLVWATPAQLRLMRGDVLSVRRVMIGGAAVDPATRAHAESIFRNALLTPFYGSSEQSFVAIADDSTPEGAAGRPVPGVEVEVRNGEIWTASPWMFERYAAGAARETRREGRFVTVGDRGRFENGILWVEGRAGRVVTISDRIVSLEPIEKLLLSMPGIEAAAVVAAPDTRRGQRLDAFVKGRVDDAEVLGRLRREFGSVAPRRLFIVDDWPLLPSGKTDLALLSATVE